MYTLYLDKEKIFECSLKVQGTTLKKSKVNLVVECSGVDVKFGGNIDESGKVSIPIHDLHTVLKEGQSGQLYLEVVADNTYFVPFKSEYVAEYSKKVTLAESVVIRDAEPFSARKHAAALVKKMMAENVSLFTEEGYDKSLHYISEYMVDNKITDERYANQIVNVLMETAAKLIRK